MYTPAVAIGVSIAGAVLALIGTVVSVRASRRPLRRDDARLRTDPGLVVACVGAVALICGLGDLVFLLLTTA